MSNTAKRFNKVNKNSLSHLINVPFETPVVIVNKTHDLFRPLARVNVSAAQEEFDDIEYTGPKTAADLAEWMLELVKYCPNREFEVYDDVDEVADRITSFKIDSDKVTIYTVDNGWK